MVQFLDFFKLPYWVSQAFFKKPFKKVNLLLSHAHCDHLQRAAILHKYWESRGDIMCNSSLHINSWTLTQAAFFSSKDSLASFEYDIWAGRDTDIQFKWPWGYTQKSCHKQACVSASDLGVWFWNSEIPSSVGVLSHILNRLSLGLITASFLTKHLKSITSSPF